MTDEAARSRVYGGVHFPFDTVAGQAAGRNVANYVFSNYLDRAIKMAIEFCSFSVIKRRKLHSFEDCWLAPKFQISVRIEEKRKLAGMCSSQILFAHA
jgi:hypothetical protein